MPLWKSLLGALVVTAPAALAVAAPLPPPPPLPPLPGSPPGQERLGPSRWIRINGIPQRAAWLSVPAGPAGPRQLWLPLEVLQGQLGFSSDVRRDGSIALEWFGRGKTVPVTEQRPLGDEVAVDVASILESNGAEITERGGLLELTLPAPTLKQVRDSSPPPGSRRVVLDLTGPALLRSLESGVLVSLKDNPGLWAELSARGLRARPEIGGLRLTAIPPTTLLRVSTLGEPARVVLDLGGSPQPPTTAGAGGGAPAGVVGGTPPAEQRLAALLGPQLLWRRQVVEVGGRPLRINTVRIDPRTSPLVLRPLSRGDGMEGLSSLVQLARRYDALVAINGGFFNRVRRLPLGALKDQGQWLSGPILNRGVVAWEPRGLPRFGRLRLESWASDASGRRWPLEVVNSGFVRKGVSLYTAGWGVTYRALTPTERAALVRDGVVRQRLDSNQLAAGIPLGTRDTLLVSRASGDLPWAVGESLLVENRPSNDLGLASNVVGGGPLLLQDGRVVLDGASEGFGSSFLSQGAPRTVIGSDGRLVWLVTLEGVEDAGPTLAEAAALLKSFGLRDALNLDGGSSTALVMGGRLTVKGRGVAAAVHHGLGLVPSRPAAGT